MSISRSSYLDSVVSRYFPKHLPTEIVGLCIKFRCGSYPEDVFDLKRTQKHFSSNLFDFFYTAYRLSETNITVFNRHRIIPQWKAWLKFDIPTESPYQWKFDIKHKKSGCIWFVLNDENSDYLLPNRFQFKYGGIDGTSVRIEIDRRRKQIGYLIGNHWSIYNFQDVGNRKWLSIEVSRARYPISVTLKSKKIDRTFFDNSLLKDK